MTTSKRMIQVDNPPAIDGLTFRHFRGEPDYPLMVDVLSRAAAADGVDRADTVESIRNTYEHLTNCDPYQDVIMVEINGELVGYGRALWWEESDGLRRYGSAGFIVPEARRMGIGRTIQAWLENVHRQHAYGHPPAVDKQYVVWGELASDGLVALVKEAGYEPIRHFFEMVRPTLDDIEVFPLPDGVEVRPVTPEQYRAIWDADVEAFRDHWGFSEPTEAAYEEWLNNKMTFQPELWQIAWDIETDEVAGQVRTYIYDVENKKFNRKRGYTEFISVRRPWRRQGLARALIALSLQKQKEMGMVESALGVDASSPTGATRVYEACGFRTVKESAMYGKPLVLAG